MAEITLPFLGSEAVAGNSQTQAFRRVQDINSRSEAFSQALNNQNQDASAITTAGVTPPAKSVEAPTIADEQARARRALDLDGATKAAAPTAGDAILGGMQKIRGIFDVRMNEISKVQNSNLVDTQTLIEMQKEVVQYTMLLDVTSKLTGKAGQVVDQLMKGQ